jgi:hypothetical protein
MDGLVSPHHAALVAHAYLEVTRRQGNAEERGLQPASH